MRTKLASLAMVCISSIAHTRVHADCALSPQPHPQGVVGLQLSVPDDPRSWEWADDLGVQWLRIELRWDWIEPNVGQFNVSYVDKVFAFAGKHPQKLMVLFNHAPTWAVRDLDNFPDHAATALAWLATRHGARVSAWEIFNEPNLPGYGWPELWRSPQTSATAYAKTLTSTSSALRAIDTQALVVSAGLSPQHDPETYARWLVRMTPPACYDAFGLHPYGQQGRFEAVQANAATLFAQEQRPRKPVWFTEYGSDQNSQRPELIQALKRDKYSSPITFFFNERDIGRFTNTYGLRRKDGEAKADYAALKLLVKP